VAIAASKQSTALNIGANASWIQCAGCWVVVADVGCWFVWGGCPLGWVLKDWWGCCHCCSHHCGVISMVGGGGECSWCEGDIKLHDSQGVAFAISLLSVIFVVVVVVSVALVLQG